MRCALLACVFIYATAYTAHDVRRHATALFVHVESPHAESGQLTDSGGDVMQGSSHDGPKKASQVNTAGMLRAPTQQELATAQMKEMQALQILQDPDLRAAAEKTAQVIQAAMQETHSDTPREEASAPTATCDKCGHNKDGVSNCCSFGGSWDGTCKDLVSEGGPHTWIDGFNACKEMVTEKELEEIEQAEKELQQREQEQREQQQKEKEEKEQLKKEKQAQKKKREEEAATSKHDLATRAVKSNSHNINDHSADSEESVIQIKVRPEEADATGQSAGEDEPEQSKHKKAPKEELKKESKKEPKKESQEEQKEESGKDAKLEKEMTKESSIDMTVDSEQQSSGQQSEDSDLSPDERAAEEYEAEAKADAEKAAEEAREAWEQQAAQQQQADDDLSPDEKAALQYEAEEAAEAAAAASLKAAGIDPEEEKRRVEKKAKKKAEAEIEAGQIAAPSKEEMDVAQRAAIVRESADRAFAERQSATKAAAEAAKQAHDAENEEGADEGLLRAPTKQELEVAAQQAAQQASADSSREEGLLRPPTPEELKAAAKVKEAEGNTAEAEELMTAAKEAAEKLGQQASADTPEEGLLRAPTEAELAKAGEGDKAEAPVSAAQEAAATAAAEKVAAQQAAQQQATQQQSADEQGAEQAATDADEGKQQQQIDTSLAEMPPSDTKPEMDFNEFLSATKAKEKLDYDPNDGLIANDPKVPRQKDDLATKVAEMNKAAEERHKGQEDDLEAGQLRTATDSEKDHAVASGQAGDGQEEDDGVPDRIKSLEKVLEKKMKEGNSKNSDREAPVVDDTDGASASLAGAAILSAPATSEVSEQATSHESRV